MRDLKEEVAHNQIEARKRFLPPDCYFKPKTAPETSQEDDIREIQDVGVPESSMEAIRMHLYSSLPIHCRKTLSQYYYHLHLQKPKQTVTCYFEKQWPHEDRLVLMVDQLWMLVLVDGMPCYNSSMIRPKLAADLSGTILTCFPSQMAGIQREFPYIYTDIVEELLGELRSKWRSGISSQLDLGFLILTECMGFIFNQRCRYNKRFRFLNVYEQQLSDIVSSLPLLPLRRVHEL